MAETLRQHLQRAANRLLNPLGLHLARQDRTFEMDGMLDRARSRGLRPATVIDVGASDGIWSLRARRHFPDASYLLFEPLEEHRPALAGLHRRHGFHHIAAIAGASQIDADLTVAADLDGSAVAAPGAANTRRVAQTTIDAAMQSHTLRGPCLLKLDTHGYEVPVLEGAEATLAQTEFLIVEAYNFTLAPGCLRFHELCAWLGARGFRCCDLADPMRRPSDGAFWQVDLAFAPANRPIFSKDRYS